MNPRLTIDELEMLNPMELGDILLNDVMDDSPDVQFIQDLLYVGCPIDARNDWGRTALHGAVWKGHLEVMEFLLSKGADIHSIDYSGCTALHSAALYGGLDVVEFLISNGALVDSRDTLDRNALHFAAKRGNLGMLKFLISKGADVNARSFFGNRPWDMISRLKINEIRKTCPELEPK